MATLTLEAFRATKKIVTKDKEWCDQWCIGQTTQEVAEYEGGCFIFIFGENNYHLVIGNQEWTYASLKELEGVLYKEWYLPEIAG